VRLSDRRTGRFWEVEPAPFRLGWAPVTQLGCAEVLGEWPSSGRHDRRPVDGDAWVEGADGYRLPTEAEWGFACRAGTSGPRYGPLDEIAWYRANSDGRSHDVGELLGNVWNWCWDLYDPEVFGAYRVLRGGGCLTRSGAAGRGFGGGATRATASTTSASEWPAAAREERPAAAR
jgi:formylglycine-generating enzyme